MADYMADGNSDAIGVGSSILLGACEITNREVASMSVESTWVWIAKYLHCEKYGGEEEVVELFMSKPNWDANEKIFFLTGFGNQLGGMLLPKKMGKGLKVGECRKVKMSLSPE